MELVLKLSPQTPHDVESCVLDTLCSAAGFAATSLQPAPCREKCLLVQICDLQQHSAAPGAASSALPAVHSSASADGRRAPAAAASAGGDGQQIAYSSAELLLLGMARLEQLQASADLLTVLQRHGLVHSPQQQQQQQPPPSRTATAAATAEAAAPTLLAGGSQATAATVRPVLLLQTLQSCGLLVELLPLHGPQQQLNQLRAATWGGLHAPVEPFRQYFGSDVGLYLSFINALTLWLLPPAIVALYTLAAIRQQQQQQAAGQDALHSPLVPLLVLFQLLWSAIGLKLWRRREAGLLYAWSTRTSSTSSSSTSSRRSPTPQYSTAEAGQQTPAADLQPLRAHNHQAGAAKAAVIPAAAVPGVPPAAAAAAAAPAPAGPDAAGSTAAAAPAVPAAALAAAATVGLAATAAAPENTAAAVRLTSPRRLLRLLLSVVACGLLLAAAVLLLLLCLNLQGYIPPHFAAVHVRQLAGLGQDWFGPDSGLLLSQVPLAIRVLSTSLFSSHMFGPAAKALTRLEAHRTSAGFNSSLTTKLALLQLLVTFGPLAYVGLAGAGAAAAAAEVAGFFRVEVLRRLAMQLLLPRFTTLFAAATQRRRRSSTSRKHSRDPSPPGAAPAAASAVTAAATALTSAVADIATGDPEAFAALGNSSGNAGSGSRASAAVASSSSSSDSSSSSTTPGPVLLTQSSATGRAVEQLLRPAYDGFADYSDLSQDIGYLTLFGCLYPPAALLCLLACLVKVKQDCLKLLTTYARPLPTRTQTAGVGGWNTVMLLQVFLAVLTSVFLSGLSSGQLVQLLPSALVPATVKQAVLAAADARPAASTDAVNMVLSEAGQSVGGPGPVTQTLTDISQAAAAAAMAGPGGNAGSGSLILSENMCVNNETAASAFQGFVLGQCRADGAAAAGSAVLPHQTVADPLCPGSSSSLGKSSLGSTASGGTQRFNDGSTLATAAATAAAAAGGSAAAGHLLLLVVLEHVLLLVLLLVFVIVPDEPAVVRAAKRRRQAWLESLAAAAAAQQHHQQQQKGAGMAPMKVHANPLFVVTAAEQQ